MGERDRNQPLKRARNSGLRQLDWSSILWTGCSYSLQTLSGRCSYKTSFKIPWLRHHWEAKTAHRWIFKVCSVPASVKSSPQTRWWACLSLLKDLSCPTDGFSPDFPCAEEKPVWVLIYRTWCCSFSTFSIDRMMRYAPFSHRVPVASHTCFEV